MKASPSPPSPSLPLPQQPSKKVLGEMPTNWPKLGCFHLTHVQPSNQTEFTLPYLLFLIHLQKPGTLRLRSKGIL